MPEKSTISIEAVKTDGGIETDTKFDIHEIGIVEILGLIKVLEQLALKRYGNRLNPDIIIEKKED